MEHFNIVIDNNVINNYTDYYFAKHPRAKKKPHFIELSQEMRVQIHTIKYQNRIS